MPDASTPRLQSTTFTPFARLALAHAVGVCGDVFVTVALADSLFFATVDADAARPKVLLYLLLTMAPFAVVAPVLGPMLDRSRGGRRLLMSLAAAGRALLCVLMAAHIDDLFLYPLAFGSLVLSKGQQVAKAALVPAVVDDERELVSANSRLALLSVLAGAVGGAPAAVVLKIVGGEWVLRLGSAVFAGGALLALGIPRAGRVGPAETEEERRALHVPSIMSAGTAMGLVRGVVGFMTIFAAFVLKDRKEPAWMYGAVLLASALGNGTGTLLAPLLRRKIREEWILVGSMLLPGVLLIFAARSYGRPALAFAGFAIAAGAAAGRLAFDSVVQRDGHEAARGRAFARFETRFQLVWVSGGLLAVLFPGAGRSGIFLVAMVLGAAGLTYLGAVRRPAGVVHAPRPNRREWGRIVRGARGHQLKAPAPGHGAGPVQSGRRRRHVQTQPDPPHPPRPPRREPRRPGGEPRRPGDDEPPPGVA